MAIWPWRTNVRNWEWKKQQMKWQVLNPLWIFKVKKCLLQIYTIGRRGYCWRRTQHGWVGGFGMGWRNPFEVRFEWRANRGDWCGRPNNTNSQASSSLWVCPITIKFCSEASLEFLIVDAMHMNYYMIKLNKMSITNINKHHWKTTNSYFRSV